MRVAAAAAVMSAVAVFFDGRSYSSTGRGEGGKLLVQPGGAAMRAFRPAPVRRAHEDFAVAFALPAMKFVDWHKKKVVYPGRISSRRISSFLSTASIYAVAMSHLQRAIEESI